jgi:hypothetical protein
LVIAKPAVRDLKEPSRDDLRRINRALEAMRADPYSGDIRFLHKERAAGCAEGLVRGASFQSGGKHAVVVLVVKRRTTTTY